MADFVYRPRAGGGKDSYAFTWTTAQYWPVGGEELQFMAYSPVANTVTVKKNATDKKQLDISLSDAAAGHTAMADVIVSTKDAADSGKDIKGHKEESAQTPTSINFHFTHILSQLAVQVKGLHSNADAYITKVEVKATHIAKTYDLTTSGWSGNADESGITYTYNNGGNGWQLSTTAATTVNGETPILLFPGTQASTVATVYVKDGAAGQETKLPAVTLSDVNSASLETGQKTTLVITVEGVSIAGLTGSVTAWTDKGTYNATIQ
ncbi:fimbrillin family protein [Bacteroides timonensis]|uniref:fimbrillin family protein n=1 Tax=Bacteroides timonensis TaxID=1470345 RepID=UPI0009DE4671